MRPLLVCLTFLALAVGCAKPPAGAPPASPALGGTAPPVAKPNPPPAEPAREQQHPDGIKLADSHSAKAVDRTEDRLIFLNVNSKGQVLLSPLDRTKDAESLDNPVQVRAYLQRRAAEEVRPAVPDDEAPPPLRTAVVFRIDKDTPFGKVHPLLKECFWTGFVKVRLRASRLPDGSEGQFALTLRDPDFVGPELLTPSALPLKYTATVWAGKRGEIVKIMVRREQGGSVLPEIDLIAADPKPLPDLKVDVEADVEALAKKLKELRTAHKDKPSVLNLTLDESLLFGHVVQLIDAGTRAGFADVLPVALDPKTR
jgi:biopolymer transport protein ExbD